MGNSPVGKEVNTSKGKYPGKYLFTLRFTFLREYPGWLNVKTFLLLTSGFYVIPSCYLQR